MCIFLQSYYMGKNCAFLYLPKILRHISTSLSTCYPSNPHVCFLFSRPLFAVIKSGRPSLYCPSIHRKKNGPSIIVCPYPMPIFPSVLVTRPPQTELRRTPSALNAQLGSMPSTIPIAQQRTTSSSVACIRARHYHLPSNSSLLPISAVGPVVLWVACAKRIGPVIWSDIIMPRWSLSPCCRMCRTTRQAKMEWTTRSKLWKSV